MNPRQRRGVLLMGLAAVVAAAVFFAVATYVAEVRSRVGPMAEVVRLVQPSVPYEPLTPEMVEVVEVPERWRPASALPAAQVAAGLVPTTVMPVGTVLQEGMLIPSPELAPGQRELAIMVDAETGVAGKIRPGSRVDIVATFDGGDAGPPTARVEVQEALILNVGPPTVTRQQVAGGFAEGEVIPVTFALSVDDSLRLAYMESFATKVRLALRAPSDNTELPPAQRTYPPPPAPAAQP